MKQHAYAASSPRHAARIGAQATQAHRLPNNLRHQVTRLALALGLAQGAMGLSHAQPVPQYWNGLYEIPNGVINGGDGEWDGQRSNWSDAGGLSNNSWQGGSAVFQGLPGTVTVRQAQQVTGGMQFVSDGYRLVTHPDGGSLNIVNDGAGVFAISVGAGVTATIDVSMSGPGGLHKTDSGELILTGSNTYQGGTTISGGRVRASVASLGSGNVLNNGILELQQGSGAWTSLSFSGSGTLIKSGLATLTLSGDSSAFTGNTQLNAGTVYLEQTATLGGALTINDGATLRGNGTVGNTTVAQGGTIAPENAASPGGPGGSGGTGGTLRVNGDLTFQNGATYLVQAHPGNTTSSLLDVSGTATLAGSVLHVGPVSQFETARTYTILQAHSLTGTFGAVASNYAYLDPTLTYADNAVQLQLQRKQVDVPTPGGPDPKPGTGSPTRPITFADLAGTANQRAVANGIESLPSNHALYRYVETLPNGAPAATFDSLSGESHASAQATLRTGAQLAGNIPLRHLHSNLTAPARAGAPLAQAAGTVPASALPAARTLPLWVQAIGQWQSFSGSDSARVKQDTAGLFLGADTEVGRSGWRLGGSLGYTQTDARVSDRSAKSTVDSYSAALYAGKRLAVGAGSLNVMGGLAYTWHDIDGKRQVQGLGQTLTADYHASTSQLFAEVGYALGHDAKLGIEPYAGVSLGEQRTRGFQERGGFAALRGESQRDTLASSTLGVRGHTSFTLAGKETRVRANLGWRHAWGDVDTQTRMAFEGGQTFSVNGVPLARNAALTGLEAEVALNRNAALVLGYQGEFGGGNRDHAANVQVRWGF